MDILLRKGLASGWVEVHQDGSLRRLCSDDGLVQSEIDLERRDHLPNPVNRAMLAHLLFQPDPGRVLLAGCGGGAIARWFHARFANTRGLAMEISPAIADLARSHFDFPPPNSTWELQVGNVCDYLQQSGEAHDFILVDIAEAGYTPDWVLTPGFLSDCRSRLSIRGVLTLNIIPRDAQMFTHALWDLRRAFDTRVLCLSLPGRGNVIAMAFNARPDLRVARERLQTASTRWGLELDRFYRRLQTDNPPGSGVF